MLYQTKEKDFVHEAILTAARASFDLLQQQISRATTLSHFDSAIESHAIVFANDWALSSTLMEMHDSGLHPVILCGRVLKELTTTR